MGSGCVDRRFLDLGSGQLHAPGTLPPAKQPPVPIGWEVGASQNRSERRGEEKIVDSTGTRTVTPQSSSP
jgi:hypothetical protein